VPQRCYAREEDSKVISKGEQKVHHVLTATSQAAPRWPSFKGKSQFVGTSPSGRVTVFYDPKLSTPGLRNAQDLVADADRVVAANDDIFGTRGGPVSVLVFALQGQTDGSGGADHLGCDYSTGAEIETCASFGNSSRVSALFEAELSECSMNGDLCGLSTGEALSRWCAAEIGNNALADFASAPDWAQQGMPDFVNRTDQTDGNPVSTGCGMAFISWLLSQGTSLNMIAQTMVSLGDSGTLAQLYAKLTSRPPSEAWPKFHSAVQGLANGITDDDPFRGGPQARQTGEIAPAHLAQAGQVFAAIWAAMQAGHSAEQVVSSVRAVLAPTDAPPSLGATVCTRRSHRLAPSRTLYAS
jgi:hypothetical protein